MFVIPLGDEPNPKGIPFATYALIAANLLLYTLFTLPLGFTPPEPGDPRVAEYLTTLARELPSNVTLEEVSASLSQYDLFVFAYGFRPAAPSLFDLFASIFLHGGLLHLAGNMLFLWIYGDNVEHRLGSVRYLGYYLATGVAATLFHAAFNLTSDVPLVGASGAISGVLGFYFLWFPKNRVRLLAGFFPFFVRQLYFPARLVLGFYLLVDNLLPFLLMTTGGVAHGAHIGGFIAGLSAAWLIDRSALRTPADFRDTQAISTLEPSADRALAESIQGGRFDEAARAYFALPAERTRHLLSPRDALALGDWLWQNQHPRAALTVFQRQLRDFPTGPDAQHAHLRAGLVLLRAFDQPTAAYQHLVEVLDHDPSPEVAQRARQALAEIAARQKFQVRAR